MGHFFSAAAAIVGVIIIGIFVAIVLIRFERGQLDWFRLAA